MASLQSNFTEILVHEELQGLDAIPELSATAPGEDVDISITLLNGSSVEFIFRWEENVSFSLTHSSLFAASSPVAISHSYAEIGNYSVNVTAYNPVGSIETIAEVIVQNNIEGLLIEADDSVLWPSGTVNITLSLRAGALLNVHCTWDYDNAEEEYKYYDWIGSAESVQHTYAFDRRSIG